MICRKLLQMILHAQIDKQRLSRPDLAKDMNISDKTIYRYIAEFYF